MADTVAQPGGGVEPRGGVESFSHRLQAHAPSHGTHTIEMQQVLEINQHISAGAFRITAAEIGVEHLSGAAAGAALRHVNIEGSPAYPYVYGVFDLPGTSGRPVREHGQDPGVRLSAENLQALSKAMHLHHYWEL